VSWRAQRGYEWGTGADTDGSECQRTGEGKSYDRGQSYYEREAVSDVVRRGETLRADVRGSQYRPYTTTIETDIRREPADTEEIDVTAFTPVSDE
jgi:uncharacterized Zn finger protein